MPMPSPHHGTLRLPNDDDNEFDDNDISSMLFITPGILLY